MKSDFASDLTPIHARGKFFHDAQGKWFLQGVTYGPFPPGADGLQLPTPELVQRDFAAIHELGLNLVRVYHPPPRWLLDTAAAEGLRVLAAMPWRQHADALSSATARQQIERELRIAVAATAGHSAIFGWLVGNEISPGVVRWMGGRRVRRFLDRLIDAVHDEDPRALASYASFPSTEYLLPERADFLTFNVFLEHRADYTRYLARLQNLADGRPLVIGEFGLDTLRNGEARQAEILTWQHDESMRSGVAGSVVFSWTDEWFNGGQMVDDWKFGLVDAARCPKPAAEALRPLLTAPATPSAHAPLRRTPTVSVIVCAYQAAATLPGCLAALDQLRYPEAELIIVDDGSSDSTSEIVRNWLRRRPASALPAQHLMHEKNRGLSAARNTGAQASTGEILAYTDADCEPDPDWLYHLVNQLLASSLAGVGGPNLPPPASGLIPAAVAASPGGPTHVLLTDTIAEHIPGCNMAFWRWAYDAVGGFDDGFWRAGDDVDFCWRIQATAGPIGFAAGAVVWHHRRFSIRCFLRQQSGYGEAEALLRFKHPLLFTPTGSAKWRGVIYGGPRLSWWFSHPTIYHGALGQGAFQSLYPAPISPVAAYLGSLEWLVLAMLLAIPAIWMPWLQIIPALMLAGSLFVAFSWMAAARIEPRYDRLSARLLVAWLAWLQPLSRGWSRWQARIFPPAARWPQSTILPPESSRLVFWSEQGVGREALLSTLVNTLQEEGWRFRPDAGWGRWDLLVHVNWWYHITVRSVTDDHGRGKCLTRVRLRPSFTTPTRLALGLLLLLPALHLFALPLPPWLWVTVLLGLGLFLLAAAPWKTLAGLRSTVARAAHSAGLLTAR